MALNNWNVNSSPIDQEQPYKSVILTVEVLLNPQHEEIVVLTSVNFVYKDYDEK